MFSDVHMAHITSCSFWSVSPLLYLKISAVSPSPPGDLRFLRVRTQSSTSLIVGCLIKSLISVVPYADLTGAVVRMVGPYACMLDGIVKVVGVIFIGIALDFSTNNDETSPSASVLVGRALGGQRNIVADVSRRGFFEVHRELCFSWL